MPKFGGIVIGVLLLRLLLLYVDDRRTLRRAFIAYNAAGIVVLAIGVMGLPALTAKARGASVLVHHSTWIANWKPVFVLPGTEADSGVNPNALGATTLFFLPALTSLLFASLRRTREHGWDRTTWSIATRTALVAACAVEAAVLVLSQSRAAWLSGLVVITAIGLVHLGRRGRAVTALAAAASIVLGAWLLGQAPVKTSAGLTLDTAAMRMEYWSRGLEALRAHPIAGIGLNTFRRVVHSYAPMTLTAPGADIAHAHNVFLQTALDAGVFGLAAYVSLILIAGMLCLEVAYKTRGLEAALAVGLLGTLIAVHLFGTVDSISLGSKVGIAFWLALGLIGSVHRTYVLQASKRMDS